MGWTVLYIAFGMVALWLLGEVLLQYKARLRWRALAFVGFLSVVIGVMLPSIVVIALGAVTFAVGQTYVTLSFRRGFSTGWALGGRPGASRRRKTGQSRAAEQEPQLEVSGLAYEPVPDEAPAPLYTSEPMPDDTGQYGVYSGQAGDSPADGTASASASAPGGDAAYASAAQNTGYGTGTAYGYDSYAGYDQQRCGYDTGQQQYAAYPDPYAATPAYDARPQQYDFYGEQQQYGQNGYPVAPDPYATDAYGPETPPGGVWVPQQRGTDTSYGGAPPPEQPYPYQPEGQARHGNGYDDQGYDTGYDEQRYRY